MTAADGIAPELDVALAAPHHLLALAEDVLPEEVEALAVSRSAQAGWLGPNHLQLVPGASLTGPWGLDDRNRQVFDLPAWAAHAYLLRCPVQRTGPLPPELGGTDELLDAFGDGLPDGVEAEALEHLRAIARRLRGVLRVSGSGAVLQPDPDASVDLTVLSPVWLDPDACWQALAPVLPGVRSLLDDPGAEVVRGAAAPGVEAAAPPAEVVAGLGPDERARIHARADAFDAAARRSEQVLSGYGLLAELGEWGGSGAIEVSVVGSEHVPTVLRDADWAQGGVLTYEIRWHPAEPETAYARRPPLAVRRQRAVAAVLVERAAGALFALVGGEVCDDDGFLVAPEGLGA